MAEQRGATGEGAMAEPWGATREGEGATGEGAMAEQCGATREGEGAEATRTHRALAAALHSLGDELQVRGLWGRASSPLFSLWRSLTRTWWPRPGAASPRPSEPHAEELGFEDWSGDDIPADRLRDCSLTEASCAALSSVLKSSKPLAELDLSWNRLGASGVKELSEGLKHPGCRIQTLKLRDCSVTGASCADLSSVLKSSPPLAELDLSCNDLGDLGVKALSEGLKHPGCRIQTLKLVHCSLTSSCCADLTSVLSTNASLTALDLSRNNLGDSGVKELCEGLKNPGCKIQNLDLSQTGLTDGSTGALCWALSTKQSLQSLSLHGNAFSGGSVASFCTLKETIPSIESEILPLRPPLSHEQYMEDKNAYRYQATFPGQGTFACAFTRLCFEVGSAGCITYDLLPWGHQWTGYGGKDFKIAGSLFDIKADPGFVKAVYLPHFVCLKDGAVDVSQIQVAHFQPDGTVTLETPSEVQPFHAVLKNPTFSKVGIVWKIRKSIRKRFPARACALLYRNRAAANITLHLFLIPNEPLLIKELNKVASGKVKIEKPSQTILPLLCGHRYSAETDPGSDIYPKELEFDYLSPDQVLPYTEIYMEDIRAEGVTIGLKRERDTTSVWEAKVRPGDIADDIQPDRVEAETFINRHRLALKERITLVEPLTDILQQSEILSEYEVEAILKESTRRAKVSALLRMVEMKGPDAKQEFVDAVKRNDPCLFKDLEQSH